MPSPAVRLYTTKNCGFCAVAKRLLEARGIGYLEIDVTGDPQARAMLVEKSGRRTVPQVFIGERSIGGYTELAALDRAGALEELVAAASIEEPHS